MTTEATRAFLDQVAAHRDMLGADGFRLLPLAGGRQLYARAIAAYGPEDAARFVRATRDFDHVAIPDAFARRVDDDRICGRLKAAGFACPTEVRRLAFIRRPNGDAARATAARLVAADPDVLLERVRVEAPDAVHTDWLSVAELRRTVPANLAAGAGKVVGMNRLGQCDVIDGGPGSTWVVVVTGRREDKRYHQWIRRGVDPEEAPTAKMDILSPPGPAVKGDLKRVRLESPTDEGLELHGWATASAEDVEKHLTSVPLHDVGDIPIVDALLLMRLKAEAAFDRLERCAWQFDRQHPDTALASKHLTDLGINLELAIAEGGWADVQEQLLRAATASGVRARGHLRRVLGLPETTMRQFMQLGVGDAVAGRAATLYALVREELINPLGSLVVAPHLDRPAP